MEAFLKTLGAFGYKTSDLLHIFVLLGDSVQSKLSQLAKEPFSQKPEGWFDALRSGEVHITEEANGMLAVVEAKIAQFRADF